MSRENEGWWAEYDTEHPKWRWQPTLQEGSGCLTLPIWFETEEACLSYIREHVVGQRLLDEPARVAVVRPTRDQLAQSIAEAYNDGPMAEGDALDGGDFAAADAVLALFGVAVSDSQETPTKGREK